jgi:ParB family chromosome partitioning protein
MSSSRLGKGFSALMGERPNTTLEAPSLDAQSSSGTFAELPLTAIHADPDQPRKMFAPTEIASLAESLQTHGLLEPIIVHQQSNGAYQIIAGERRFRAASQIGWTAIPAIIRKTHSQSNLILALVENLQREDLGALEEAHAYQRLRDEYQLTQDRIAQLVGKRRATVANALRLLTLGEPARDALANGLIDKGHARALLALSDRETQDRALTRCVKEGWSVRATENFAKKQKTQPSGASDSTKASKKQKPEDYSALSAAIGLEVNLSGRKITLSAKNREEAHLFLARLTRMVRGNQGIDQKELS